MEIQTTTKTDFIRDKRLISSYFMSTCKEILAEEEFESLASSDTWNIKLTINDVEMDYKTINDLVDNTFELYKEGILRDGFRKLLHDRVIPKEVVDKLNTVQNAIGRVSTYIDTLDILDEDKIDEFLWDYPSAMEYKIIYHKDSINLLEGADNTVSLDFFEGSLDKSLHGSLANLKKNEYFFYSGSGKNIVKKGQLTEETIYRLLNLDTDIDYIACIHRTK